MLAKKPLTLKKYILKMASGATPAIAEEEKFYSDKENGYPFLRVQNLNETGNISLEDVKYINEYTHTQYLKRSQVAEDDLLIKITGVGRMAVAGVPPKGFEGNINQHIVVAKTKSRKDSEILAAYLNSDVGEKLASRRATGGTRPALDYPALKSIPIVFDKSILELSTKAKENKLKKEIDADNELHGFDEYFYKLINAKIPAPPVSVIENRMFHKGWGAITGNRIDPRYHQVYFDKVFESLGKNNQLVSLRTISSFITIGKTPSKENYTESGEVIVKAGCLKHNEVDWTKIAYSDSIKSGMTLQDNDILFLSAAHQISYIGKNPCIVSVPNQMKTTKIYFVGEILCIRPNELVNPYYLLALFNTEIYYKIVNRETRGQTSHLYPKDMARVKIPLPDRSTQDIIGNEFKKKLFNTKDLLNKADSEFNIAKREIDNLILE